MPKPHGVVGCGCDSDHPDTYSFAICDGICTATSSGSPLGLEDPALLSAGIVLWSDAMTIPAEYGGGPIDPDLAAEALALPFEWSLSAQVLGRLVGSIMVLARGQDFFIHPAGPHNMEDHLVADLSADPCRLEAGSLSVQALLADLVTPGSGWPFVQLIPEYCESWEALFVPMCEQGPGALDCAHSKIMDVADAISTPIQGPE